ncbi:MAG: hypothetical protein RMJ98_06000 [Myxococcales bacterium]|nr:hypothetical protein [Polyangiaceae bacterium]MDW8248841.1 hypothetical protein [Myxococcales bacterium]
MRFLLSAMLVMMAACSSAGGTTTHDACSSGAECASGVCSGEGRCIPLAGGSGGEGGSAGSAGETGGNGEAGQGGGGVGGTIAGTGGAEVGGMSGGGGSGGAKVCAPNNDGTITREETPLIAGAKALFLTALKVPVNTAGQGADPKNKFWDFSGSLAGDHTTLIETQVMEGKWFSPKFPGASYAMRLSDTEELLGVFEVTDNSLLLRGVVSPTDGLQRTELSYNPPVTVLAFPMKLGSSWTTQTTVTGLLSGVVSSYFENYQSTIDMMGKVKTPFGEFPALRINLLLTRTVGALITTKRTLVFSSECYGTVARVISNDNELNAEFSTAAELSRLSP